MEAIETIIFTDNVDPRIRNVWDEIRDVYERENN